jgi:hypothetical protein
LIISEDKDEPDITEKQLSPTLSIKAGTPKNDFLPDLGCVELHASNKDFTDSAFITEE